MWRSQLGQDRWAANVLGNMRNGYFVELGASQGLDGSNTVTLEREFGWTGICIEPNERFFNELCTNRTCLCINALVLGTVREVAFKAADHFGGVVDYLHPEICDPNLLAQASIETRTSRTLADLLDTAGAPKIIDFLSLDTEGSEPDILSTFPFDRYCFRTICVEHNGFPDQKDKLRMILRSKSYTLAAMLNFNGKLCAEDVSIQDDCWIGSCL